MRQFFLFSLLALLSYPTLTAQNGRLRALEELPKIKGTTTLIVLYPEDEVYNKTITRAIDLYWDFTEVKFVQVDELREYAFDTQYSMLVRNNSERFVQRVGRTDRIQSNHLALYLCGKGDNMMNYTGKDALTQWLFPDVMDTQAFQFKLITIVQSMNNYLNFLDGNKLTEINFERKLDEFTNKQAGELKEMTLYVHEKEVTEKVRDLEKLKKAYGFEVQLVDKEAISKAVFSQDAKVAILHLDPRLRTYYILSAKGGRILLHQEVNERGHLKLKDFAAMAKQIKR
ncbi:MAG: hypothetical protein AAFR61_15425 [Bacteroidota bacterium]